MFGRPLPAETAGLGEFPGLLLVGLKIRPGHINAVFLDVVIVITETVDVPVGNLHTGLHQFLELIVGHGQRGIDGAGEKQGQARTERNPLVIETLSQTQADSNLIETNAPGSNPHSFLQERVLVLAGNDDQRIVHGGLQDVDQRDAAVNDFKRLAELQGRGLAFIVTDAAECRA